MPRRVVKTQSGRMTSVKRCTTDQELSRLIERRRGWSEIIRRHCLSPEKSTAQPWWTSRRRQSLPSYLALCTTCAPPETPLILTRRKPWYLLYDRKQRKIAQSFNENVLQKNKQTCTKGTMDPKGSARNSCNSWPLYERWADLRTAALASCYGCCVHSRALC